MAEKKKNSRALKAVNDTKKKTGNPTSSVKKKDTGKGSAPVMEEPPIPLRTIGAAVSFVLFVVFLLMGVKPEGVIMKALLSLLTGLVGKVGFYFSIPALFYLFVILISSKGKPVRMRCACLISFVLLCSCIHHMFVNNQSFIGGFKIVKDLFDGGQLGTSGGLICGLIAMLIRWACGPALSYILFIISAVLTLLASMKITPVSMIRAIQNRPRDNWQEGIAEEKPEPAAVVVNHIANKRIEHNRQKRMKQQLESEEVVTLPAQPKRKPQSKQIEQPAAAP